MQAIPAMHRPHFLSSAVGQTVGFSHSSEEHLESTAASRDNLEAQTSARMSCRMMCHFLAFVGMRDPCRGMVTDSAAFASAFARSLDAEDTFDGGLASTSWT
jgi:hypothetical protein